MPRSIGRIGESLVEQKSTWKHRESSLAIQREPLAVVISDLSPVAVLLELRSSCGLYLANPSVAVNDQRNMGAFLARPECFVHRLRTAKTISRTTAIVPAIP